MNTTNFCPVCKEKLLLTSSFSDICEIFIRNINEICESAAAENDPELFCPSCLGIFQPKFAQSLAVSLKNLFDNANYDVTEFNLCISYPLSLIIRDKIVQIRSIDGFDHFREDDHKLLKDICKFCYRSYLGTVLNLKSNPASDFNITINFQHDCDGADVAKIESLCSSPKSAKSNKSRKRRMSNNGVSRSALTSALSLLTADSINDYFDEAFLLGEIRKPCTFEILFERQPLYIGGRYLKFSRYVHQSPWIVDEVQRSQNSVQELIERHLTKEVECQEIKFTASGREDADVRMLGRGRPFALQCFNPRRVTRLDLDTCQKAINSGSGDDIEIRNLQIVGPADFESLTKSEDAKTKSYVALCFSSHPLNLSKLENLSKICPLEIVQKTPIRVLHRRPLIERKRKLLNLSFLIVDDHHFQLFLTTEAGTYVKEFVHGDFGRTSPSLSQILDSDVDILELDVEKVDFDWPPPKISARF